MAGTYDSEQQRLIDRLKCIAFREARDAGATFINRKWIAEKFHRSIRWVEDTWNKIENECWTEFGEGRPSVLSQKNKKSNQSTSA